MGFPRPQSLSETLLQCGLSMATVQVRRTCSNMGSPWTQFLSGKQAPTWALHSLWFLQGTQLQGVVPEPQARSLLWRFPLQGLPGGLCSGHLLSLLLPQPCCSQGCLSLFPLHSSPPVQCFALFLDTISFVDWPILQGVR